METEYVMHHVSNGHSIDIGGRFVLEHHQPIVINTECKRIKQNETGQKQGIRPGTFRNCHAGKSVSRDWDNGLRLCAVGRPSCVGPRAER